MSNEVMEQALRALELCVETCFDQRSHQQVRSIPEHFVNQTCAALRAAIADSHYREKEIMKQAQLFAQAWALIGSSADWGDAEAIANIEKKKLKNLLR